MVRLTLSKKVRWLLIIGAPTALLLSLWIGSSSEVDLLVHQAKKGNREMQLAALAELANYGGAAASAAPDLAKLLQSSDGELRRMAARTVLHLDHREAVRLLSDAMKSKDPGVRLDAREALESVGTTQAQAVVQSIEQTSEQRYQRSRVSSGWFKKMHRSAKRQEEEKYRRHRRIYGE